MATPFTNSLGTPALRNSAHSWRVQFLSSLCKVAVFTATLSPQDVGKEDIKRGGRNHMTFVLFSVDNA